MSDELRELKESQGLIKHNGAMECGALVSTEQGNAARCRQQVKDAERCHRHGGALKPKRIPAQLQIEYLTVALSVATKKLAEARAEAEKYRAMLADADLVRFATSRDHIRRGYGGLFEVADDIGKKPDTQDYPTMLDAYAALTSKEGSSDPAKEYWKTHKSEAPEG
jgi:hypothetical protein